MRIYIIGPDKKIKGGISTLMSILYKGEDSVHYLHENSKNVLKSVVNVFSVVLRILCSRKKDIFHFNVSVKKNIDRIYIFVLVAYILKRKYVAHSHWFELPRLDSRRGRRFYFIYSNSSHAVFLSKHWKETFYLHGYIARNNSIIHNCADSDNFCFNGEQNDAFVFVGSLSKRKGVDVLVNAYQNYRSTVSKPKNLIIIGSRLKNSDIEIPDIPGLELYGEKSNKEVNECIASSFCVILPSKSEGVPIVVIEALLNGTPVITSNTYGLESVIPSIKPFLVNYGDAIGLCKKMIEVEGLIDEQKYCFEEAAIKFNIDRFKKEFNEVYKKVALSV